MFLLISLFPSFWTDKYSLLVRFFLIYYIYIISSTIFQYFYEFLFLLLLIFFFYPIWNNIGEYLFIISFSPIFDLGHIKTANGNLSFASLFIFVSLLFLFSRVSTYLSIFNYIVILFVLITKDLYKNCKR